MIPSTKAHITRVQQTAGQLSVDLPTQFVSTIATAQQLIERTEQLEGHTGELNHAVIQVLLSNGDPTKDRDVQRLSTLRTIGTSGIREAGSQHAADMVTQAVHEHADQICDQWAVAVQPGCDTLIGAAAQLSDIPDLRHAEITALKSSGRSGHKRRPALTALTFSQPGSAPSAQH